MNAKDAADARWLKIAELNGYSSESEMFHNEYWKRNQSVPKIAKFLEVSSYGVTFRMRKLGMKFRPRGGSNARKRKVKRSEKCSCCGRRAKAEGNRFLCEKCYHENQEGYEWKVNHEATI